MENPVIFRISREKHLDHMVRVVPFIVFCYAVHCFIIMKITPFPFASVSLFVLGGFLATMILGFITYDLKHQVEFYEDALKISFPGFEKWISYREIQAMKINEPGQTFSNLSISSNLGRHTFFFIDDAEKIKAWIEQKNKLTLSEAA